MILQGLWFVLWAVLWIVYFVLDGTDLGAAIALPFIAHDDDERSAVLASIGPVWDGNEVWLVSAGGVTFAAFPRVYAVMFSSMYSALLLLLFALILRGVAIEFRGHRASRRWRHGWEATATGASFAAALLLGVAFGNLWRGVPMDATGRFQGGLLVLLNPFAVATGILFLVLFVLGGCLWVSGQTTGGVCDRAVSLAGHCAQIVGPVLLLVLVWSNFTADLFSGYFTHPFLFVFPVLAILGIAVILHFVKRRTPWKAWAAAALTVAAVLSTGFAGMYPSLLPTRTGPGLTAFNASSSPLTLKIMLVVALTFVPIVIVYQTLAWRWTVRAVQAGAGSAYDEDETTA